MKKSVEGKLTDHPESGVEIEVDGVKLNFYILFAEFMKEKVRITVEKIK